MVANFVKSKSIQMIKMGESKKLILVTTFFLVALLILVSNETSAFMVPEVMVSNFVKPITTYLFDIIKQLLTGLISFLVAAGLFSFSVNNSQKCWT